MERVFTLTDLGRKLGSSPSPNNRDQILDYIYTNRTVRSSELASYLGMRENRAVGQVRPYIKRGLVVELTH